MTLSQLKRTQEFNRLTERQAIDRVSLQGAIKRLLADFEINTTEPAGGQR